MFVSVEWVFFLVSLLLICAHSFLARVSETRHTQIQNRKSQSKNSCPKIDQLWLFWCLVFFGCLFLLNEFFALWVTYLFMIFFGYSVKNLIHSDPETKNPSENFGLHNWSIMTIVNLRCESTFHLQIW